MSYSGCSGVFFNYVLSTMKRYLGFERVFKLPVSVDTLIFCGGCGILQVVNTSQVRIWIGDHYYKIQTPPCLRDHIKLYRTEFLYCIVGFQGLVPIGPRKK